MVDVTASDFDRLFDDTLRAIRPLTQADAPDDPADEPEPIRGRGEALDGYIRVTAKPGGQLESVELEPRALRRPSDDIAEAFMTATNAALADLQEKLQAAMPAMPDQQELMQQLQEFQNQSVTQMHRFLTAIAEVQDVIERNADRD